MAVSNHFSDVRSRRQNFQFCSSGLVQPASSGPARVQQPPSPVHQRPGPYVAPTAQQLPSSAHWAQSGPTAQSGLIRSSQQPN
ncbi:hypothetical protein CRG98_002873 [Punica granatum]|uniref:Uncharacterized protein n=1 Tax=Punica granatum TaxID=22663 RepID=A0A2I0L7R7_PUNGR|nr:hypothetical protein CRG98_002873 [Punica granatum]